MKRITLTLTFLVTFFCGVLGQISIDVIPDWDKLPVRAIHRIYQDSEGYMWYGTFGGLFRYDGYSVKPYRSDFKTPGLFSDNYVTNIREDTHKHLWIGTIEGLYVLDKGSDSMHKVDLNDDTDENIFTLSPTKDGRMWVSVLGRVYELTSDGKIVRSIALENNAGAYFVYLNNKGETIVSIEERGMFRLDAKDKLKPYFFDRRFQSIEGITWDKKHKCYWLNTWDAGIVRFNPSASVDKVYTPQQLPHNSMGVETTHIYHMVLDEQNNDIWTTTWNGLNAFHIGSDGMLRQKDITAFLPKDMYVLYDIIMDKKGNLWTSSLEGKGLVISLRNKEDRCQTLAENLTNDLYDSFHANPIVNTICRDGGGGLWISQSLRGALIYNSANESQMISCNWGDVPGLDFLPNLLVPALENAAVWGTNTWGNQFGKLRRTQSGVECVASYNIENPTGDKLRIKSITQISASKLVLGTNNGLYIFNLNTSKFTHVKGIDGDLCLTIVLPDGTLWLAADKKGLYAFKPSGEKGSKNFYPLEKKFSCMALASDGKLWIGTKDGELLMVDTQTGKCQDLSSVCDLNGDMIVCVQIDELNHVWLATDHELKEFNPVTNIYRVHNYNNRETHMDRLQTSCRDGRNMWFAGNGGIMCRQASHDLESIPEKIKTTITNILVGDIPCSNTLPANATDIRIEFSTFDLLNSQTTRYAYRMEGMNDDWVYLPAGQNWVFFNNLSKGKHRLYVKSTGSNGLWSSEVTELVITRLPHWWESWWAYCIYVLLALFVITYAITRYKKYVNRRTTELLFDSKELMDMKRYAEMEQPATDDTDNEEYVKLDKILLDKAHKTVMDNLSNEKFDVNMFAYEMNMSRSTLNRKIKVLTDKTPLEYIKDIKMELAGKMLLDKTATVRDVISVLGYVDYKNFAGTFKKYYGMSPTEWQKKQQEETN